MSLPDSLSHFHGGLELPGHKAMSTARPIGALPAVDRYVIPLQQHIGEISEPLVKVGDKVRKGQMLARPGGVVSAAIHAPVSGTVVAIDEQPVPHPSGLPDRCITIENDYRDEWIERQPLGDDYNNHSSRELRKLLCEHGIVGLGGATFPAHIKETEMHVRSLILNGVECEPYISCDDMLMRERAREILAGADIIGHIIKARECVVAIEDNKPEAITAMQAAIDEDGTGFFQLRVIPTRYPSGGEKQLIQILTGKEVPSGRLPAELDMLVHNVGTAYAVYQAVFEARPLISRIVTVTGNGVAQPQNLEAPIGAPMHACIEQCGGYTEEGCELVMGGPMMGLAIDNDRMPVTKACNCLLVMPCEQLRPADGSHQPCIRCGKCVAVCPAKLLPQQLYWYAASKNFDRCEAHHLFDCIECGCCAYVCPSDIPLVQYYRFAKTDIRNRERERKASDLARKRHEAHQARIERQKREREERLRKKKEMLKKKEAASKAGGKADGATHDGGGTHKAAIEAALARAQAKKAARAAKPADDQPPS